jgi:hypothetical protein
MLQADRRQFVRRLGLGLLSLWAAGITGLSSAVAQVTRTRRTVVPRGMKSLSTSGYLKLPARGVKGEGCETDTCNQAGDVELRCTVACDGCDACNSGCDKCNGCNVCDAGCDVGCNNCNRCNGCDGCDMCDAICNTCNQCDHGGDVCVVSCDTGCDGCNQGDQSCGVDIDKNGTPDAQQVQWLEGNIKALEHTLSLRKTALTRLRR